MELINNERSGGLLDFPAQPFKDKEFSLKFFRLMVRARVLEERLIKMAKAGDGFFWIGGPGEEAFNVALGLLVDKGEGVAHDMLHLHYRNNGVVLAMGAPMIDFVRQMRNVSQDPFSGGRNFVSHIAKKEWNVFPVTSTIETQFAVAPGTAMAQKRATQTGRRAGVSIVIGGDAGTAEGDFASCLIWSSRPAAELPLLMIVTNNKFGISTAAESQHGERYISDRGKAFGIKTANADGNVPEKVWSALVDALEYVRETQKPYLLELSVSRLNGHSSSTGGARIKTEDDTLDLFEKKLLKSGWISKEESTKIYNAAWDEANSALEQARKENWPDADTFQNHTFANSQKGGIPGRDF
jgi:2-oxoisovalerate dehydrogenase E1 component alpha subunit